MRNAIQTLIGPVVAALIAMAGFGVESVAASPPPDTAANEWLHLGGSADSIQYSPNAQIDTSNVASLGLPRAIPMPVPEGLVGNPLIEDGIAYQSTPRGGAVAVDLEKGTVLWNFEPAFDCINSSFVAMWGSHTTRGSHLTSSCTPTA